MIIKSSKNPLFRMVILGDDSMRRWLVKRPNDKIIITIMKNKCDGTYSFINLTKEHVCPCKFNSIDDALKDMNRLKDCGKIINYFELE